MERSVVELSRSMFEREICHKEVPASKLAVSNRHHGNITIIPYLVHLRPANLRMNESTPC